MSDWKTMFEGRLDVQPPIADQQLKQVPPKRGVVALLASEDRPIVLITAADIRARIRNRLKNPTDQERRKAPDLHNITRAILWKRTSGHFETDLEFLELSRVVRPERYSSLLAWKPAWFVHVGSGDSYPHFLRTRDVFAGKGVYLGPFVSARSADKFIDILRDGFNLCRHSRRLRASPNGRPCSYAQMGRCLSPCDGTVSMQEYQQAFAAAVEYASGRRNRHLDELTARMKQASKELRYEQAAGIKARLARLGELQCPEYSNVAPAELFRFLMIQQGEYFHQAKVFLVNRGSVERAGVLEYPPRRSQVIGVLKSFSKLVGRELAFDEAAKWRMGLVARYLFSSDRRKGLMLTWREDMDAAEVMSAIEASADVLRLRAPKRGKSKKDAPAQSP